MCSVRASGAYRFSEPCLPAAARGLLELPGIGTLSRTPDITVHGGSIQVIYTRTDRSRKDGQPLSTVLLVPEGRPHHALSACQRLLCYPSHKPCYASLDMRVARCTR